MSRGNLTFVAGTDLEANRLVTITKTTGVVNYTAAEAAGTNGITRAFAAAGKTIHLRGLNAAKDEFLDLSIQGAVVQGDELEVGADGKGEKLSGGVTLGLFCTHAVTDADSEVYGV